MNTPPIHVVGASLTGLAVAARLARAGHRVSLDPSGPLGGRAAPIPLDQDHPEVLVDRTEPVITLPAAWRDLLKKSGRGFNATLVTHQLELVPAPPAEHRFTDGTALVLGDDRGAQHRAIASVLGDASAQRWTALLDELDQVWQQLRRTGVERPMPPLPLPASTSAGLWSRQSLGHLARRLHDRHLAELLLSAGHRAGAADPERAPALLATRWCLIRTFGRWHLAQGDRPQYPQRVRPVVPRTSGPDAPPHPQDDPQTTLGQAPLTQPPLAQPLGALVPVLTARLAERGVGLEPDAPPDAVRLDTRGAMPPEPPRQRSLARPLLTWWDRHHHVDPILARPPQVRHELLPDTPGLDRDKQPEADLAGITELVEHDVDGPVITWQRTLAAGRTLRTTHDHRHLDPPDPDWGWDVGSWQRWLQRPRIPTAAESRAADVPPDAVPWRAGVASHAGNEPWAEVLSAALLAYEVHEALTGQDIRPTNRAATPIPRPDRD